MKERNRLLALVATAALALQLVGQQPNQPNPRQPQFSYSQPRWWTAMPTKWWTNTPTRWWNDLPQQNWASAPNEWWTNAPPYWPNRAPLDPRRVFPQRTP